MTQDINNKKVISIFGSTGSVGSKTFDIAMDLGYNIAAITCNKNYKLAILQAERANVKYIGVSCKESYDIIKDHFATNRFVEVIPNEAMLEICKIPTDISCMAIISPQSYLYTYETIKHTKRLAISSKEAIIILSNILISESKKHGTEIIPVDSEHSALFQCLQCTSIDNVSSLTITASGGGMNSFSEEDLDKVNITEALHHPTWNMGAKITIDSSTMMNKAIEIIEASILFDFDIDKITALIHPQSIVHCLITLKNNGQIASLSIPDMAIPISYSLTYPNIEHLHAEQLDLKKVESLNFCDMKAWQQRSIDMAKEAYKSGKTIAFSSANDYAVDSFLSGRIKFKDIWSLVEYVVSRCNHDGKSIEDIDDITSECNIISSEFIKKYGQ